MAKINNDILSSNSNDDTAVNKNPGYTAMSLGDGNDTYIIENISKSWTDIHDGYVTDKRRPTDLADVAVLNEGHDTLQIKNVNAGDLTLFFDVSISDKGASHPDDGLYIIKKSSINSVINQAKKYLTAAAKYENGQINEKTFLNSTPQSGLALVDDYFGTTNNPTLVNGKGNYGPGYIETIQTVDKKGIKKTLNISSYVDKLSDKITAYIIGLNKKYGTDKFKTALEVILSGSTKERNDLINLYKNQNIEIETTGTKGTDKFTGEAKTKNTFVFNKENGKDIINFGKGEDIIKLNKVSSSELTGLKYTVSKGNGLVINYTNADSVEIAGYLKNQKTSVKEIITSDGAHHALTELAKKINITIDGTNKNNTLKGTLLSDTISGYEGNDTIKAGKGDDTIIGGKGNDKLYGEYGDNTFIFNKGDGNDYVYSGKNFINGDTIKFADLDYRNLKFSANGNNLVVRYGENFSDSVDIVNYLKNPSASSIKKIEDKKGYDILSRLGGVNKIYIDGKVNKKNSLRGTAYDDVITGGNLSDTIKADKGDDIITGGKGNDKLYGEYGDNTFVFNKGDGNDYVYSGKNFIEGDTLQFNYTESFDESGLSFSAKGNNLIINYGNNDSVTVVNYLKNPAQSSVKYIKFGEDGDFELIQDLLKTHPFVFKGVNNKNNNLRGTNSNDLILGGNKNDTIRAGSGKDVICGGAGNDKIYNDGGENFIYFKEGDGKDTVCMGKGKDTLVFDSKLKDTLSYTKSGNNLIINYGNRGDSVTISGYYSSKSPSVNDIVFADYDSRAASFDRVDISLKDTVIKGVKGTMQFNMGNINLNVKNAQIHTGNEKENFIVSSTGYDHIKAGAGNDTIVLQSKKAVAEGGEGNDTYTVSSLKNKTIIFDNAGDDTVYINEKLKNLKTVLNIAIDEAGNIIKTGNSNATAAIDSIEFLTPANLNTRTKGKAANSLEILDIIKGAENGSTKKIATSDGRYTTTADINRVANEIAGWLKQNDFASVDNALREGSKNQIQALMNIENSLEWHNV